MQWLRPRRSRAPSVNWTCDAVLAALLADESIDVRKLVPIASLTPEGTEGTIEPGQLAPLRGHRGDAVIRVDRTNGRNAIHVGSLQIGGGHSYMGGSLINVDGRDIAMPAQVILLGQAFPQTLLTAIVGLPVVRVIDHPALRVQGLDVVEVEDEDGMTVLRLPTVEISIPS